MRMFMIQQRSSYTSAATPRLRGHLCALLLSPALPRQEISCSSHALTSNAARELHIRHGDRHSLAVYRADVRLLEQLRNLRLGSFFQCGRCIRRNTRLLHEVLSDGLYDAFERQLRDESSVGTGKRPDLAQCRRERTVPRRRGPRGKITRSSLHPPSRLAPKRSTSRLGETTTQGRQDVTLHSSCMDDALRNLLSSADPCGERVQGGEGQRETERGDTGMSRKSVSVKKRCPRNRRPWQGQHRSFFAMPRSANSRMAKESSLSCS